MARIGILSDSHGRDTTTRQAVKILLDRGAQTLIHLGDIVSHEVIDALTIDSPADPTVQVPCHIVFGNVDWDSDSLADYAKRLDIHVDHPVGTLEFDGKALIFLHGDDTKAFSQALDAEPAWLLHGHSHEQIDRRQGPTRIINPGALFRAQTYTVALLDTQTDQLDFHTVGGV